MRIAIVINTSWNIYNFRMGLIRSFLADNHEVYAVAPCDGYETRLTELGCRHRPVSLDNKGSNPLNDLRYTWELYKTYRRIRPDVVLHFTIKPNLYGTLAAKLLGIPIINNVSGLGTVFLRENRSSQVARFLYRQLFRFPNRVFFQNRDDLGYFIQNGLVNASVTDVLPGSGVNVSYFKPEPFRRNEPFAFLLAARLIQDKGIHEYAEAARLVKAQFPNVRFRMVGFKDDSPFGISEADLRRWTDDQLIEYEGSTDDIRTALIGADCVVLPSYREGTPRSLLEAAAMGKPLIATNVPGCIEVVDCEVNGYLCEARNAQDLARQMIRMLALDDTHLAAMGRATRHKVESKFDEILVISKYRDTIAQVLRRDVTRPAQAPVPAE